MAESGLKQQVANLSWVTPPLVRIQHPPPKIFDIRICYTDCMISRQRNPKKQGAVGVGLAVGYFSSVGYIVSIPLTDSQEYDLLVDDGQSILKVQVKTSTRKTASGYEVQLRTGGGNQSFHTVKHFNGEAVDLLMVITPEGMYVIPMSGFTNRSTLSVNVGCEKFRVRVGERLIPSDCKSDATG